MNSEAIERASVLARFLCLIFVRNMVLLLTAARSGQLYTTTKGGSQMRYLTVLSKTFALLSGLAALPLLTTGFELVFTSGSTTWHQFGLWLGSVCLLGLTSAAIKRTVHQGQSTSAQQPNPEQLRELYRLASELHARLNERIAPYEKKRVMEQGAADLLAYQNDLLSLPTLRQQLNRVERIEEEVRLQQLRSSAQAIALYNKIDSLRIRVSQLKKVHHRPLVVYKNELDTLARQIADLRDAQLERDLDKPELPQATSPPD